MFGDRQSSISVHVKRVDRTYRPGDKLEGKVVVDAYKGWQHQGVKLYATGYVYLNTSAKGVGIMDLMSNTIKPIIVLKEDIEIAVPGNFYDGETPIPFEFAIKPAPDQNLYESYHGVYLNVIYGIRVECDRGVLKKSLSSEIEFVLEIPGNTKKVANEISPEPFNITAESLGSIVDKSLSDLKISGNLHRSTCSIAMPFTGDITIEKCDSPIRSIELQLVRIETVEKLDGYSNFREATEIQNIQIADGDVCRGLPIPLYFIFPRIFTCPTVKSTNFKIEFEVNLVIIFLNGYQITENFPITIFR